MAYPYAPEPIKVKASYPIRIISTKAEVKVRDPRGVESTLTTPFTIELPLEGTYSMRATRKNREIATEFHYPEKKNVNFQFTLSGLRDKAIVR